MTKTLLLKWLKTLEFLNQRLAIFQVVYYVWHGLTWQNSLLIKDLAAGLNKKKTRFVPGGLSSIDRETLTEREVFKIFKHIKMITQPPGLIAAEKDVAQILKFYQNNSPRISATQENKYLKYLRYKSLLFSLRKDF